MKYTYSIDNNVIAITNPDGKNCLFLLGQNLGFNKGLELGVAITGLLNGDLVVKAKETGKEAKPEGDWTEAAEYEIKNIPIFRASLEAADGDDEDGGFPRRFNGKIAAIIRKYAPKS